MALKTTVYLNDQLEQRLQQYLTAHPGQSLSTLIQEALEQTLQKENAAVELLKIAGIAENTPPTDASNREILP